MPKYVLLFREAPDLFTGLSPAEIQAIIEKFTEWRRRLENEGRFMIGQKLRGDGRVLRRKGSQVSVTDGPYLETKEVLGGYFVVQARDYHEAVELARAFPLQNGVVEIREIELE
jgi:hypothetical protein